MAASRKKDDGFTKRLLLSLMVDLADAKERAERIEFSILILAREHGLSGVLPDPAG